VPLFTNKVAYSDLNIRAPVTLRFQLPVDKIKSAKTYLGTTKDTTTVDNVKWELVIDVCKEGEPDCATPVTALRFRVRSDRANSKWVVDVVFDTYYVSPVAMFTADLFPFGRETDVVADITFSDSTVNVVVNGKSVVFTDTFKRFEQIRRLSAQNMFLSPVGSEVAGVADPVLVFNLNIVTGINVMGIIGSVIPLVVALSVVGVVLKTIPAVLKR
jgi:hypothetical protein